MMVPSDDENVSNNSNNPRIKYKKRRKKYGLNTNERINSNLKKKTSEIEIEEMLQDEEEVQNGISSFFGSILSNSSTTTSHVVDMIKENEDVHMKNFEQRYGCSNLDESNKNGDDDDGEDIFRLYNYLEQQYEDEDDNMLRLYYNGRRINQLFLAIFISSTLSIILHLLNTSMYNHRNTMNDPATIKYKHAYDFNSAMKAINILPPTSSDPAVQEYIPTNTSTTVIKTTTTIDDTNNDAIDEVDYIESAKTTSNLYSIEEMSRLSIKANNNQNKIIPGASMIRKPTIPILSDPQNITIPQFDNLKDVWEAHSPSDHAVFLHFPKTGGTTTKNILGVCYRKVLASEAGIKGHANDKELAVVKGYGDSLFVNIDSTTSEGIKRAYDMGFADAHLADLTVTPFLYIIDTLFKPTSQGRVFSMFRHPIERAVSMLNYIKYAEWEPSYVDDFKTMTLEEYAKSPFVENNFYTRVLSDTMEGTLTTDHLAIAIYNLKKKVLVGMLDKLDESLDRFEAYFGWKYSFNPTEQEKCRKDYLVNGANIAKKKTVDVPKVGSNEYELIVWQNQYDLKLYDVVMELFQEQKYLVADKPSEYRLVDTTCSDCLEKKHRQQGLGDTNHMDFDLDAKPDSMWDNM